MKTALLIIIPLFAVAMSCRSKPNAPAKPVPTILEGKKIDVSSIIHKKRGADLVEALYEELTAKSAELQELEEQIKSLQERQINAADSFKRFDERNRSYYDAAEKKLDAFQDSLLKKKIKTLIGESRHDYAKLTHHFTSLDSLVRRKNSTIADLHLILKITKTLPLIEQYQEEQLPTSGQMEEFNRHLDSLMHRLDSLGKS